MKVDRIIAFFVIILFLAGLFWSVAERSIKPEVENPLPAGPSPSNVLPLPTRQVEEERYRVLVEPVEPISLEALLAATSTDTSLWPTYTDPDNFISLQYPPGWGVIKKDATEYLIFLPTFEL